MDAITHTILAMASLAGAWYGGRALQVREARRLFGHMTSPEMLQHMKQLDRLIEQMTFEDESGFATRSEARESEPLQLELFPHWGRDGQEKA